MNPSTSGRAGTIASALLILLTACGGTSPSEHLRSPSPGSGSTEGAAQPSAGIASAAASPDGGTPADPLRMVMADELRLRTAPGTDAELVGGLARGEVVRTVSGPVEADGFGWFEVDTITGGRGWVAGGDGTDPWLSDLPAALDAPLLLSFEFACDVTGPFQGPSTLVFEDGRVLHDFDGAGLWQVRTLSPSGIEHVRENVVGSPYLRTSGTYTPVPRAGAEPPGHGACQFTFLIPTSDPPIQVTSIGWFGDAEESEFYEPSPERKTLDAIARNLMAIDSVLTETLWESGGWLPWIADDHLIALSPGEVPPPDDIAIVEPESMGLGDLDGFGGSSPLGRCGLVSREQAFGFARALNTAGHEPEIRLNSSTSFAFSSDSGPMYGFLIPSVAGSAGCEELS